MIIIFVITSHLNIIVVIWLHSLSVDASILFCLHSGSANQMIRVCDLEGNYRSIIRYHDGFMGQRIGPINCMAFHPHRVRTTCKLTGDGGVGGHDVMCCCPFL